MFLMLVEDFMSELEIKGRVFHIPGPWGMMVPVGGVKVSVWDRDFPGKGDDLILSTMTDPAGNYSGSTGSWRDTLLGLPDPTDLPLFFSRSGG
jgi:hypothetical protein